VADVITTAVIRESFASIVREMRRMMIRSSYSSIIYEGYDFSCVIIDAEGRLVAQSGEDHPFHIIPVAWSVRGLLDAELEIGPDDIFLHNDPYTGGTHLNDVAVVYPVHRDGRPILFVVIRSHWADIGGMTPGSLSGAAREILHEGLRLNHVRVPKSGRSEVMDLIFDNVRISDEALSDFHAVIGTCRVAEKRLLRLIERYGKEVVLAAVGDVLQASEARMRAAIDDLPDGVYRAVSYLDGNADDLFPLQVEVALTVEGDSITADFDGTSAQVSAPLNAGPAIAPTSVLTIVKSFLDPGGAVNSGTLAPVAVKVPKATILHAEYPAPCGGLNEVRFAADAAVMGALARVIPERVTGDVRGTSNHTYIGGFDARRDKPFLFYEYPSGGTGAFDGCDGNHAVRAFNEGENVSIQSAEMIEASMPLRVERNELRTDSGGPGQYRGGCGLVREIKLLADTARFSTLSDRNLVPPFGVNGGQSGAPNRYTVIRDGTVLAPSEFPGKVSDFVLREGDVVRMESSGGGGYGFAHRREAERIQRDWDDGLISEAGLTFYGATLDGPRVVRNGAGAPEAAARLIIGQREMSRPRCAVSRPLASDLDLQTGQMVEIVLDQGPALRFWVDGIEDGDDPIILLSSHWRDLIAEGDIRLRATDTGSPQFVRNKQ